MSASEDVLTVCDGIGAVHEAWKPLDWRFAMTSEIEGFPRAVLEQRQGAVDARLTGAVERGTPLWGDFTAIRIRHFRRLGVTLPSLLAGGTPCQAFSVAGLRESLGDARGNLTLQFVKLANAIDAVRVRAGLKPIVLVWENVPGVLSVKDNAFGCFLAGVVGAEAPLVPGKGQRWDDAGLVVGPRRVAAWRILDAQYFGLAQRRRRVFVVASAREGFDPSRVLFEPEGVRRHSPPRREAGEKPAASLTASSGGVSQRDAIDGPVVGNLTGGGGRDGGYSHDDVPLLGLPGDVPGSERDGDRRTGAGGVPELRGRGADLVSGGVPLAYGGNNRSGPIDVAASLSANKTGSGQFYDFTVETFVAHALDARQSDVIQYGDKTGPLDTDGWTMGVLTSEPIAFDTTQITHPENRSNPQPGDPAPTLAKGGHPPTIAFQTRGSNLDVSEEGLSGTIGSNCDRASGSAPMVAFSSKDYGADASEDVAPTLRGMGHDGSHANGGGQVAVAFALRGRDDGALPEVHGDGDTSGTLRAADGGSSRDYVAFHSATEFLPQSSRVYSEVEASPTLQASGKRDGNRAPQIASASAVRRLMPVECERLQGFRDHYTAIIWKGRLPEDCPDGPRYKALGNSMAVPVMAWIGRRIATEEERRLAELGA